MRLPEDELSALRDASLLRQLPDSDSSLINFSSNDYLGLSHHPKIIDAYKEAVGKYGAGSTASRLICGTSPAHEHLEATIAQAKNTEAAITFANGYSTAVGVISALLQKGDTVILDKLCHASLIDGARMSGATLRVFPHNNLQKLASLLESTTAKANPDSRTLVITESVFSMDGDLALLHEISSLTRQYGCLLMVDEAHALGVMGPTGMGLAEELGIQDQIDFHMGTLGKAAGVAGGYLACSKTWAELLINRARSFIYSTSPPPAQASAAAESIRLIREQEGLELRNKLWQNIKLFQEASGTAGPIQSAIIPWMVGASEDALALAARLQKQGFHVPAIRYPTVPPNTARLRITISAGHQPADIENLALYMAQATLPCSCESTKKR
ncbi:MAG: aminotransferase class I/II-fold pyridoxal phosphate-dependent enzyme [Akkermansiaceae bacterium]